MGPTILCGFQTMSRIGYISIIRDALLWTFDGSDGDWTWSDLTPNKRLTHSAIKGLHTQFWVLFNTHPVYLSIGLGLYSNSQLLSCSGSHLTCFVAIIGKLTEFEFKWTLFIKDFITSLKSSLTVCHVNIRFMYNWWRLVHRQHW